jgi:streptomycin 6-kinase
MLLPAFYKKIVEMRGSVGESWLKSLDQILRSCESRWQLKVGEPFDLTYNYVAATDHDAVIKVCLPCSQFEAELNTLLHYNGKGMCKVIAFDTDMKVLLIEQLKPGTNVRCLNEEEGVLACCSVITEMQSVDEKPQFDFQILGILTEDIHKLRYFAGNLGFNDRLINKVEEVFAYLNSNERNVYLLHGDLHHDNILADGLGWKAIDPKGLVGEVEHEVVPFLLNNLHEESIAKTVDLRLQYFSKRLQIDIRRVYGWAFCRSVLSALWNLEDNLGICDLDYALIDYFDNRTEFQTTHSSGK